MERAERKGDPWSGHIAFPGGALQAEDRDARRAAERETLEEIGVDLSTGEFLGRLDDVASQRLPVVVSGFVYGVKGDVTTEFNEEIVSAFWVSFKELLSPDRREEKHFEFLGVTRSYPALDLLGPDRPLLWGITYSLVASLLRVMGHEIPVEGG